MDEIRRLRTRLERLERGRRWHGAASAALALVAVLVLLGQARPLPEELRVKRLAIVEGDGTEVAVLNWMGRALLGRNGAPQVTLDRVGLTLRDGNGVTRGEFAVLPLKTDHAPALQIYDRDGQLRFSCGATSDLGPVIFLNEKDGMTGTMVDERGIFIDLRGEEGQPYRGAIALTGQDPWGLVLENRLGARADVGLPPDGSVCACA